MKLKLKKDFHNPDLTLSTSQQFLDIVNMRIFKHYCKNINLDYFSISSLPPNHLAVFNFMTYRILHKITMKITTVGQILGGGDVQIQNLFMHDGSFLKTLGYY